MAAQPVAARGVCWATTANPTIADSRTSDGGGTGPFVSSLTGLTPSTLYHYRAYATNTAGTAYGGDLTFTTPSMSVDAGADQEVFEGVVVHLHAAVGCTVTLCSWTERSGRLVTISGGLTADASFTAPTVWTVAESTLVFRVNVVGPTGNAYDEVSVRVRPLGDANRDNCVDVLDLLDLIAAFGKCQGTAGYNAWCDFGGDGCVDVLDLLDLINNFGRSLG